MRILVLVLAAGVATPLLAAGLDQSGQPVTLIFREGRIAEIGFGVAVPQIEGIASDGSRSGNVFDRVTDFGFGVKTDLGPDWSVALVVDKPYGAAVNYDLAYPAGAFPFAGTQAEPVSLGVTGLVRRRLDAGFSLHGGLRAERFGGSARLGGTGYGPLAGYDWTGDADWGLGWVAGAAYERAELALRVALTWGSEIRHEIAGVENFFGPSTTEVTMPQSVNLDFQTGIAPRTLVFGAIRWVDWQGWRVAPPGLLAATGLPLVEFDSSAFTYRIGIGRQFTETLSAAIEVAHETAKGQTMTALDPYDGYTALGVGANYDLRAGVTLGGGVAYSLLGDAEVVGPTGTTAHFDGSSSVSARLKLSLAF